MGAPQYSAAEYLSALQALMPRGRVWPRDGDSTQAEALAGLTPVYARQNQRAADLLVDAFPATTLELLPEWEETLNLPDPCAGPSPTVQARRGQVLARIKALGGQSASYFVAYAAALGYDILVADFVPARAGLARAGQAANGPDWAHAWAVYSVQNAVTQARAGLATAGEPIAYWSNAVLECEINAIKPAHTVVLFVYGDASPSLLSRLAQFALVDSLVLAF